MTHLRAGILYALFAVLVPAFGRVPVMEEMSIKQLLDGLVFTDARDNNKMVVVLMWEA